MALTRLVLGTCAVACWAASLAAQSPVLISGRVVSAEGGTPLRDAIVRSRSTGASATTNRLGTFSIATRSGDTLMVSLVGYRPSAVAVGDQLAALVIALDPAPVALPELVASADAEGPPRLAESSRWRISGQSLRTAPFTVEPDLLRVLALYPAVSFSSPLSGRPIVRGYDPSESSIRVDGFEVVNPYHLARSFFVFPPDAAESVTLDPGPQSPAVGGTLSAAIDIAGRSGVEDTAKFGAAAGFGSLSAWTGGGRETTWFAGARGATLSLVNLLTPGRDLFPYTFGDLYATVARPGAYRVTAFATRDHLGKRPVGSGADWGTVLLGARWSVLSSGPGTLTLSAHANRSALDASALTVRSSTVAITNRFRRAEAGLTYEWRGDRFGFEAGATLGGRGIRNDVIVLQGTDFPTVHARDDLAEGAVHVAASFVGERVSASIGGRVDGTGAAAAVQPRAEVGVRLSDRASATLRIGRNARLHHLISEQITEPEPDFAEFWLSAGANGVPTARVDHGAIDLRLTGGDWRVRIGAFGSRGTGIGELSKSRLQGDSASAFRFGASRTIGLEVHAAVSAPTAFNSLAVSYVLSSSRRNFGEGWRSWGLERRHRLRLDGQAQVSSRTVLSSTIELASGLPFTPVAAITYRFPPGGDGSFAFPTYVRGIENSARGGATFIVDVAVRRRIGSLFGGRGWIGASVSNVAFGPVAPEVPDHPGAPFIDGVPYKRLYRLPPVPTVFLELRF